MWKAIVPAVLWIALALGAVIPAAAQGASDCAEPGARVASVVIVPVVPVIVYVGNIPILLNPHQVVVVQDGVPVPVVLVQGGFFLNGVLVADLRPNQVVVVSAQRRPSD